MESAFPDTTSEYAEEGTTAHGMAEACLRWGFDPMTIEAPINPDRYPLEMREHVQTFVNYAIEQSLFFPHMEVEVKVTVSREVWGTSDLLLYRVGSAAVVDLKYGQGVRVDAEWNEQLMIYAIGAHKRLGLAYEIDTWDLTVHQPRLDNVSTWTVSTEELLQWEREVLEPAVLATFEVDAPLVPGEKQCRFCKASAVCPARAEQAMTLAQEEFCPVRLPQTLNAGEVAQILPKLAFFEQWAKDLRAHALQLALNGTEIPGFKLVTGRSIRQYRSPEVALGVLTRECIQRGLDPSKAYTAEIIGIPAAEKLLGGPKKAAPILADLIFKPEGKPSLVPVADYRSEIIQETAESMFEPVDLEKLK